MGLDEERVLAKGDPKVKQYNFALSMGGGGGHLQIIY